MFCALILMGQIKCLIANQLEDSNDSINPVRRQNDTDGPSYNIEQQDSGSSRNSGGAEVFQEPSGSALDEANGLSGGNEPLRNSLPTANSPDTKNNVLSNLNLHHRSANVLRDPRQSESDPASDDSLGLSSLSEPDRKARLDRKMSLKDKRKSFIKKRLSFDKGEFPVGVQCLKVYQKRNIVNVSKEKPQNVISDLSDSDSVRYVTKSANDVDTSELSEGNTSPIRHSASLNEIKCQKETNMKLGIDTCDEFLKEEHNNVQQNNQSFYVKEENEPTCLDFSSSEKKSSSLSNSKAIEKEHSGDNQTDSATLFLSNGKKEKDFSLNRENRSKSYLKYKKICFKLTRMIQKLLEADELKNICSSSKNINELVFLLEKINELKYFNDQMIGYMSSFSGSETDLSMNDTQTDTSVQNELNKSVLHQPDVSQSKFEDLPNKQETLKEVEDIVSELSTNDEKRLPSVDDLNQISEDVFKLEISEPNSLLKEEPADEEVYETSKDTASDLDHKPSPNVETFEENDQKLDASSSKLLVDEPREANRIYNSDKVILQFKEGIVTNETMDYFIEKFLELIESVHTILYTKRSPFDIQLFTTILLEVVEECNILRRLVEEEYERSNTYVINKNPFNGQVDSNPDHSDTSLPVNQSD